MFFGFFPLPADLPSYERRLPLAPARVMHDFDMPAASNPLFRSERAESFYETPKERRDSNDDATDTTQYAIQEQPAFRQPLAGRYVLRITQSCFHEVLDHLTRVKPERAGLLFGPQDDETLVTHFIPDRSGHSTEVTFTIHAQTCNVWLRKFRAAHMDCKGLAHSHPPGVQTPSGGDLRYVNQLFANPKNESAGRIFLPIVCGTRFYPYVVERSAPFDVLIPELVLV